MIWNPSYYPPGASPIEAYEYDEPSGVDFIVCKYCGVDELHWEMTNAGWRLFTEEGIVHTCAKYKPVTLKEV
jgi:hypothetical protein